MARVFLTLLILFGPSMALAGAVTVAVASNFLTVAEELISRFEADTGHEILLSHGSTGQLYSQIDAGAPFDIFLSADSRRPELLEVSGKASRVTTYALGRLVLISRERLTRDSAAQSLLGKTVALADPTVAPYGLAATAAMENLELDTATFRPVLVSNVGQVATVFVTGNADAAFVSESQLPLIEPPHVLDLDGLYPPIRQDAALLSRAADNAAARDLFDWLVSAEAREVIAAAGYDLPE